MAILITFKKKQPTELFYKKVVLKNFAIFTWKHLCWSLLLIQNILAFLRAPILKNICERLLHKNWTMKLKQLKIVHKDFNFTLESWVFLHQYISEKCLFHDWFHLEFVITQNISLVSWEINSKQQILTKVNQKKIKSSRKEHACERAFNFDHWKMFSENFKPMRVWL